MAELNTSTLPEPSEPVFSGDENQRVMDVLMGKDIPAEGEVKESADQPEMAQTADAPEKGEQEAVPQEAEKPAIDYSMKVPITGGEPVELGKLKDLWQDQQAERLKVIEQQNEVIRLREQADNILSYVRELPPQIAEQAKADAISSYKREMEKLQLAIPDIKTEAGMNALKGDLFKLADEYGAPHHEMAAVSKSWAVKMMHDYIKLKNSIKAAKEQVKPLRDEKPKAVQAKPGHQSELQQRIAQAKHTGNTSDEAVAVAALLRSVK